VESGITVSTGQVIALIVGGLSLIGTLLGIIRHQYEQRLRDNAAASDVRLREQRESYDQRMRDHEANCTRALADKDTYITRANLRMDEQERTRERQAVLIEEAISAAKKQAEVSEAMYDKLAQTVPRRRGATGDD
jgi:uncharacterized protein involved in exopolysaccharide biosynthesis